MKTEIFLRAQTLRLAAFNSSGAVSSCNGAETESWYHYGKADLSHHRLSDQRWLELDMWLGIAPGLLLVLDLRRTQIPGQFVGEGLAFENAMKTTYTPVNGWVISQYLAFPMARCGRPLLPCCMSTPQAMCRTSLLGLAGGLDCEMFSSV